MENAANVLTESEMERSSVDISDQGTKAKAADLKLLSEDKSWMQAVLATQM